MAARRGFRPVQLRTRTGAQSNGHQSHWIGVPWQIAEAVPGGMEFVPWLDPEGRIVFEPAAEAPRYFTADHVLAALVACGLDRDQASSVCRVLRAQGDAGEPSRGS
jgi:hypothetical protein